ncbi:M20/M25/M40 family metallo-hydrolase [Oceanobacillus kapialis]|uniref:M20/M25/M40 family metallo-hydrolase n=1 Tax=Oceanobacillus kapialis TaxID=481353 RepID=A0ABW5Q2Q1_9BACI
MRKEEAAGGGSDGNFTAAMGIPALDGLGAAGEGIHARNEHIIIDEIPDRTALLCKLICSL